MLTITSFSLRVQLENFMFPKISSRVNISKTLFFLGSAGCHISYLLLSILPEVRDNIIHVVWHYEGLPHWHTTKKKKKTLLLIRHFEDISSVSNTLNGPDYYGRKVFGTFRMVLNFRSSISKLLCLWPALRLIFSIRSEWMAHLSHYN